MNTQGFTLIELMVSVTIFIIVMTISLGALLSISTAERKAEAVKTLMNNLNFALESMTRTIRTGYDYDCGGTGDCAGGTTFSFVSASGQSLVYCLGSENICNTTCQSTDSCSILRSTDGGAVYYALTDPEVKIADLQFYLQGSTPGDGQQPRLLMTVSGRMDTNDKVPTEFKVQTSVTQRLYDQ